jgi:hypothetical protein
MLSRISIGDKQRGPIFISRWPKNESDSNDDEYELFILKYDVNQDALV